MRNPKTIGYEQSKGGAMADNQEALGEMMSRLRDSQREMADSLKKMNQALQEGFALIDRIHDELIQIKYK